MAVYKTTQIVKLDYPVTYFTYDVYFIFFNAFVTIVFIFSFVTTVFIIIFF